MSTEDQVSVGTSQSGIFQEALTHAIQGLNSPGDQRIFWRVTEITGIKGGFIGLNNLTVKVAFTVEGEATAATMEDGGELPK